jgi:diadenylate cyclase
MDLLEHLRLLQFGWRDAVEIAVVAFVLYRVLLLIHGTRAAQMLLGIATLCVAYAAAWVLKLTTITSLLAIVFKYGAFVVLIVFQPELRAALAHLGQSRVTRLFRRLEEGEVVDEISDAVERLSRSSTGAIIAVERDVPLGDYVETGRELSAKVSGDLLATIFTPYSPLHDGAVVIRGDTIVGAGCILPLTQAQIEDRSLGTRHRAALGLSEETDALVIVVSEETGMISLASGGRLLRGLSPGGLRDALSGRTPRATAEQLAVVAS